LTCDDTEVTAVKRPNKGVVAENPRKKIWALCVLKG
jgi:hypothetical protein